jgi:calcineurin-like phosphoesterase family protein
MATKIWLISDTHFGHENMYKFTTMGGVSRVRSRFDSSAEGDDYMMSMWSGLVKPEDHIYHLGDVAMSMRGWVERIKSLPGHKRLILGNHDKDKITTYLNAGFEKIMSYRYWDHKAILSHVPIHPDSLGSRLNIHGHIHEREPFGPLYRNVSVEQTDYAPVELDRILASVVA